MCLALFSFIPYLNTRKAYEMHVIYILDGETEAQLLSLHSYWVYTASKCQSHNSSPGGHLQYPSTQVKEKS